MVPTRPLISKSSSICTKLLVIVLRAPLTIDITFTCLSNSFQFSSKVHVFIYFFAFFQFYPDAYRNGKVYNLASSRFFFVFAFFLAYYHKVW